MAAERWQSGRLVGRACLSEIARVNRFDLRQNKQRRRYVRPGQVLAIMGPSGSGKTTLLTILAARARPTSGQLRLNGAPYDAAAKALIALVPQDDALFPNLTVRRKVSSLAIHLGRRVFRPSRSALAIDPSRPIVLARGWHAFARGCVDAAGARGAHPL